MVVLARATGPTSPSTHRARPGGGAVIAFVEGRPIPLARIVVSGPPLRGGRPAAAAAAAPKPLVTRLDLARARRLQITVAAASAASAPSPGGRDPGAPLAQLAAARRSSSSSTIRRPRPMRSICSATPCARSTGSTTAGNLGSSTPCCSATAKRCRVAFVAERPGRFLSRSSRRERPARADRGGLRPSIRGRRQLTAEIGVATLSIRLTRPAACAHRVR